MKTHGREIELSLINLAQMKTHGREIELWSKRQAKKLYYHTLSYK